jgi:hypothetical protein
MSKDKKSITEFTGHAFFNNFRLVQRLPTTAPSKNLNSIGHHCCCNDDQFDCNLLHDITSFFMDSIEW